MMFKRDFLTRYVPEKRIWLPLYYCANDSQSECSDLCLLAVCALVMVLMSLYTRDRSIFKASMDVSHFGFVMPSTRVLQILSLSLTVVRWMTIGIGAE